MRDVAEDKSDEGFFVPFVFAAEVQQCLVGDFVFREKGVEDEIDGVKSESVGGAIREGGDLK